MPIRESAAGVKLSETWYQFEFQQWVGKRSFESPDAGGHKQSFHEIFAMIRKNQVARIPANDIKTQRIQIP